jgi:ABC-2 type transport system permease protein
VLTINEGFEEKLESGETDGLFEIVKRTGTYSSELFDSQLTQYISAVTMYMAGGNGAVQACREAREVSKEGVDVTVENFGSGNGADVNEIGYFTQYLGYIFICILVNGLSPILIKLNQKDVRRRMECSSTPVLHRTLQIFAGSGVIVFAVWLAFAILAAIVYRRFAFTQTGLLCMLNSFVFIIVAAGITLLVAQFDLADNIISMVSNVVSLGMSFLCGVFVPQYMLGEGVLAAAKFLPAYWYVRANNMLCGFSDEAFSMNKYLGYLGIELMFAAVLFTAVILLSRSRRKTSA